MIGRVQNPSGSIFLKFRPRSSNWDSLTVQYRPPTRPNGRQAVLAGHEAPARSRVPPSAPATATRLVGELYLVAFNL
jgi:hypothetical protein